MTGAIAQDLKDKNAEYDCQTVYLQWEAPITHTGFFGDDSNYEINLNAYCLPRSLQQRQILSLEKACEKDPKPQCYQKDFLDYLSNLQPTTYIHLNKPSC